MSSSLCTLGCASQSVKQTCVASGQARPCLTQFLAIRLQYPLSVNSRGQCRLKYRRFS